MTLSCLGSFFSSLMSTGVGLGLGLGFSDVLAGVGEVAMGVGVGCVACVGSAAACFFGASSDIVV